MSDLLRAALVRDRLEIIENIAKNMAEAAKGFEALGELTNTECSLRNNLVDDLRVATVLIQQLRKMAQGAQA